MLLSRQAEFSPDMSWQQATPVKEWNTAHAPLLDDRTLPDDQYELPKVPGGWVDVPTERQAQFDDLRTIGQAVNSSILAQMLGMMVHGKRRCTDFAVAIYRRSKRAFVIVREFRFGRVARKRRLERNRRRPPSRSAQDPPRRSPCLSPQIVPAPFAQEVPRRTPDAQRILPESPKEAASGEVQEQIKAPSMPDQQESDSPQHSSPNSDIEPAPSLTGDNDSESSFGHILPSRNDVGDDDRSPQTPSNYDGAKSPRDKVSNKRGGETLRVVDYASAFNEAYPMQARGRLKAKVAHDTGKQSPTEPPQQLRFSISKAPVESWYDEDDARPYNISEQTLVRRAGYAKMRREEQERKVREEQRRLALDKSRIKPLLPEWEAKVKKALIHGHGDYTPSDFAKVIPAYNRGGVDQWLNDESVNGYLKLATTQYNAKHPSPVPKSHAFTSFMFQHMMKRGGYKAVERWAKRAKIGGSDLLKVDTVFIPVNHANHWTLMVVYPRKKTAQYYDSMGGNTSLRNQGGQFFRLLKEWLLGELGDKFRESEWNFAAQNSPQQDNCSDCGVFAITTAKMLILDSDPMNYGPRDIPTQRKRIVAELINGAFL